VCLHAYSAQRTRHTLGHAPGKAARQTRALQSLLQLSVTTFFSLLSCSKKSTTANSGLYRMSSCFRLCSSQRHHPPYALYCSPSLLSLECSAIVSPISLPFCECCDSLRIGRTNHKGTHEPGSWSEFSEHNTPHDKAKSAPGMPLLLETPPSFCCPITMQLMEDPVSFGRRKWAQPSSHCMHLFRSPLARTLCRERALSLTHTHSSCL